MKDFLVKLLKQQNLSMEDSAAIMDELTDGNLPEAQISSLLTSLQIKGVTAEELAGFASVLKQKASSFPKAKAKENRLDTCGTGGSGDAKTFNVSTIGSFICAAAGAKVVKHGNRGITSKSGSADLLEKLGVNIEMSTEKSYETYKEIGLTFLYARKFHSAMRFAGPTRASLGFRTAFNLIGPLSNPAHATHQLIGVFDEQYTEIMCNALNLLGLKRAMVVHGLDEISLSSPTKITELKEGLVKTFYFKPDSIEIKKVRHADLVAKGVEESQKVCMAILNGIESSNFNLVCLNAGAALYVNDKVKSIKDGYELARETAKSGKALSILNDFIKLSNS